MLMDISYDWVLKKSANFHCQSGYWCHKQHNQWYNICVIVIFSWKYHLGLHFYRTFISLRRNILCLRMKVWVPPRKAKFGQWVGYRWVLSFLFERLKYLKTNCFKYSNIVPRKTETCCEVTKWIHLIILIFGSGVQIPHPPLIWWWIN